MPYLLIRSNVQADEETRTNLQPVIANTLAEALNKSADYVMIDLELGRGLTFAGTTEPCAFCQLKSLGLEQAALPELSSMLCGLLESELGVPPGRIYIHFESPERAFFGWNGKTFA